MLPTDRKRNPKANRTRKNKSVTAQVDDLWSVMLGWVRLIYCNITVYCRDENSKLYM